MKISNGNMIKKIRIEKGLTQKQLGELCGIADSNIRKYENGNQNPKLETLQKIATALDVPVLQLMDDTEKKKLYSHKFFMDLFGEFSDIEEDYPGELDEIKDNAATVEEFENRKRKLALLSAYNKLNELGQEKATEQVEILTKVPEYRKDLENKE